jgi:hypothetical protein
MKKLLGIAFLLFCCATVQAQTITIYDLTNISNLTDAQAHNFLVLNRLFKELYTQDIDGFNLQYYQFGKSDIKKETVIVGAGIKKDDGSLLRKVTYNTTQGAYLYKVIAQAKQSGLNLAFQGADRYKNIYLLENFLYSVHIYINVDNSGGTVEVQQKDFEDFD